jgi:LuxR family transcriptional regulator, quorum-sensing system regulator RaiR
MILPSKLQPIGIPALTARELEVLTLVAQGYRAQQICTRLGIAKRTVDAHMQRATFKLGASNSTHAVAMLIANGTIAI